VSDNTERFPEKYRLTKPSDFQEVFKTALRHADKKFLVLTRNNDMRFARLGLAISAKRITTAVQRNKVKRLIRESFRRNKNRLKGLDIVVVAQNNIDAENAASLRQTLAELWDRLAR
jgi:ribonuclease P protein component